MTFVSASLAIAGLAAIAIPIVIHLLSKRRRKPVEWAAMRFLLEAFRRHNRRLQLQQWILLLVRCAIPIVLGLALARPLLEDNSALSFGARRVVFLIIDDGMASGLENDEGAPALTRLVDEAVRTIRALDSNDAVSVILASRPARAVVAAPSTDHASVIKLLRLMEPTQCPSDLPGAIALLALASEKAAETYDRQTALLLSEFRAGSVALDRPLDFAAASLPERLGLLASLPARDPVANVQVTSIEPLRRIILPHTMGGSGQIRISLARSGGELPADVTRVRLVARGSSASETSIVQWEPGQTDALVDLTMRPTADTDRAIGLVASIDDDRLAADNRRFTIVDLRQSIRLLLVDRRSFGAEPTPDRFSAGQWLRRALSPGATSPMDLTEVEPAALKAVDLRGMDAVIIPRPDLLTPSGWVVLREFACAGGLLLMTPPADTTVHRWTEHLASDLGLPWRIDLEVEDLAGGAPLGDTQPAGPLLQMIAADLEALVRPVVTFKRLAVDPESTGRDGVLLFDDGRPLVLAGSPRAVAGERDQRAAGLVMVWTVAPRLDWTNLPSKPLMVPLVHEAVREGLSQVGRQRQLTVGDEVDDVAGGQAVGLIGAADDAARLDGETGARFDTPGLYRLIGSANQTTGVVGVNVDPNAGRTDPQARDSVEAWLQSSGRWRFLEANQPAGAMRASESGSSLAGSLLLALLALVLLETILARRFSYAHRDRGGTGGLRSTIDERTSHGSTAVVGAAPSVLETGVSR